MKAITKYQNSTLAYYQRQIGNQQKVLQRIKSVLPPHLAEEVEYCVISKKTLIMYVKSNQYLAQLLFFQQAILENLGNFVMLEKLEVRMIGDSSGTASQKQKTTIKRPAERVIEEIRQTVQADKAEDELSQALLKLSLTLQKLS